RLLSSILLFAIALLFLLLIIRTPIGVSTLFESLIRTSLIGIMVLAYVLVRTAHYWLANSVIVLSVTISLFVLTLFDTTTPQLEPLNYLIILLLYSSLFLSLPITILLFMGHLGGLLIIPLIIAHVTLSQMMSGSISFYLTLGLFILIITIYRNKLETERKTQLIKDEQFLSNILNAVQDGISVVDRDLNIQLTNQEMERLYAKLPPISCKCGASYPYKTPYCPECPTVRTLETGQTYKEVIPYSSAAVKTGWIELTTFPMLDENGRVGSVIEYVRDISEQKRIETELRKLSRAVEQNPSSIVITDINGTIEYVNPKFTQVTGYSQDYVVGGNPRILKSEVTDPVIFEELWENVTAGKEWHGEFINRKKNGDIYWESALLSPIKDENGEITHIVAVKEDITERKQLEQQLLQHQEHLETLVEERTTELSQQNEFIKTVLESLTYPFYVLNVDDYSLSIANEAALQNRSIENLTCYQLAHARNTPCSGLEHPCPLHMVKTTNKPVRMEHEHVTREGKISIVEVYAYPIFDEDEQVKQVIEYTQDITEYKQAEQKLWQSEHRYRSLFEAANDAIFILDLQGNHITANQRATQMLGYDLEELIGLSFKDIVMPEAHHQSESILNKLLAGESLALYERWFRRKDGDVFPVEINVLLVQDQTGKPLHIQSIVRDISQRKQAEQKLISAYEQLKELDHLKDEFVSSVSHELRTPLTNIKLYHHLLSIQPAKSNHYLAILQLQTTNLEKIVESMLYMLTIQQQIIKPEFVVLNMNDLVQKAVDAHQVYTQENVKLLVYPGYPETVSIQGDFNLLEQAISVLLDNAVKYSRPHSLINISMQKKAVDDQEWIGVNISDSGSGIPIEEIPHIFERFFRGKTALETGTPGAGLGLAIAQAIVKEHQGYIDVQNKAAPDQGTVFSIWLPVSEAAL
ncbi:MAG: PAS domain S-box protein, partial [Anaerolineae bacterium]|nr:PAS domain S-box protein [Anaerolineae bacterium]